MRKSGEHEFIGDLKFFVPCPLPPKNPQLHLDAETTLLYGDAMHYLGKLNEMTNRLPNVERFIKAYVNKEAQLSSSIENINTTLLDIFTQPILKTKPDKTTQLVMNYTKSLYKALSIIQKDNLPIVTRVILGAHKELMMNGEGDKFDPGNYRKQTVKVGDFIPPPAPKVPGLMSDLEKYINTDKSLPTIIKAGLVHVQFETIHPFLDGNGRIGRLLIVLMLIESGILSKPIIYPSYYFKKNHFDYYKFLDGVRTKGDFESWIKYYLSVIKDSSMDACRRLEDIENLNKRVIEVISNDEKFKKSSEIRIQAISVLFTYPVININKLCSELESSYNTASKVISDFMKLGILVEENLKKRGRLFKFKAYFDILEKEYQSL